MEEQLISKETEQLAKEKGFELTQRIITTSPHPKKSNGSFIDKKGVSQSLLQRWLREVHRIDIDCQCDYEREKWTFGYRRKGYSYDHYPLEYITYEEALEKGLQEALKIII
jgi:hypothetical protein